MDDSAAGFSDSPIRPQDGGNLLQSWPASALCTPNRIPDVEPQFWEAIIGPIRNEHLQKDGLCEMLALADLKGKATLKGTCGLPWLPKLLCRLSEC